MEGGREKENNRNSQKLNIFKSNERETERERE